MRTFTFLFLLLICSTASVRAQNTLPLVNDSATWWIQSNTCLWNDCIVETEESFVVDGDTVIGNQTYHKLWKEWYKSAYGSGPFASCDQPTSGSGTADFALREANGKVWLYDYFASGERVIYDFTAQIGDSIPDPGYPGILIPVTNIDTVVYGGVARTRWEVENGANFVIEGIGATTGLTQPLEITFDCGWNMLCYAETGNVVFPDSTSACDPNIGHLSIEDQLVSVPLDLRYTNNGVLVTWPQLNQQNISYELYDASGRALQTGQFQHTLTLDSNLVPAGIYVFRAFSEGKSKTAKVIFR